MAEGTKDEVRQAQQGVVDPIGTRMGSWEE